MKEDILATYKMIEMQVNMGNHFMFGVPFSTYQKVYGFTNENIDGYMNTLDFQNKDNVLSVMASGDLVFNLVGKGIKNIDTFDTNKLTEYYALGIKKAAILKFNYKEFLKFYTKIFDYNISLEELTELIRSLFSFMESKYRNYWESIVDYNYKLQKEKGSNLNLFELLLMNLRKGYKYRNTYLLNEDNYNNLRFNLAFSNITFKNVECLELPEALNYKYDFIFLSNIADYFSKSFGDFWGYERLREVEENFDKLLKDGGVMALAYLMNCYSSSSNTLKTNLILDSLVTAGDLREEEIILFPQVINNRISNIVKDGMILKRKL